MGSNNQERWACSDNIQNQPELDTIQLHVYSVARYHIRYILSQLLWKMTVPDLAIFMETEESGGHFAKVALVLFNVL